ncbi:unnamed protein product [Lactuca saligna]|uniref:Uncharacterized protein n=1 Tax=Lactuca saligna TaxID=75948 RepID=A0AA35Z4C4_LACSI|nr:unnamed protein product [Lactuca saligna]
MLGVVQGWKCPPQIVDFISSLGWSANNESFGKLDYGKVDFTSSKYTILSYMLPIKLGKSLYSNVRELVENEFDSAGSIGEIPLVEITIPVLEKNEVNHVNAISEEEEEEEGEQVAGSIKISQLSQRRSKRSFSLSKIEALVEAVETLGDGTWRDVKMHAFDDANHRTYVDLKDKWKTLVHTASISPQQRRG